LTVLAASAALLAGSLAVPVGAQAKLRGCNLTTREQRHLGASYVTSLRVSHTTCTHGKRVVKAFNNCRHQNGGPGGHCNHRVLHYRCKENRYDVLKGVQYDSRVTCTRGAKVVKFTYTQNL
jgi:hypothetical protein